MHKFTKLIKLKKKTRRPDESFQRKKKEKEEQN